MPLNRNLEAMARQLYDYWFVQFDFPDENGRPYKSSGGKMVWNPGIGQEIPLNWEVKPLYSWLTIRSGYPFKSDTYKDRGQYRIVTIKNVQDGYIDASSCAFLDDIPSDVKSHIYLKKGDCLISLTGNCGRIGIIYEENLLLNQRVGVIETESDFHNYAVQLFSSSHMHAVCEILANGAAQANLSPINVCKTLSIVPAKNVIASYNVIVTPINLQKLEISEEIIKLTKHRDELLPLLMNGQVSVMPPEVNCDLYLLRLSIILIFDHILCRNSTA